MIGGLRPKVIYQSPPKTIEEELYRGHSSIIWLSVFKKEAKMRERKKIVRVNLSPIYDLDKWKWKGMGIKFVRPTEILITTPIHEPWNGKKEVINVSIFSDLKYKLFYYNTKQKKI